VNQDDRFEGIAHKVEQTKTLIETGSFKTSRQLECWSPSYAGIAYVTLNNTLLMVLGWNSISHRIF